MEQLKQEKCRLQDELRDQKSDTDRKFRLQSTQSGDVKVLEDKLDAVRPLKVIIVACMNIYVQIPPVVF